MNADSQLARLRNSFAAGRTRPLEWRMEQLARLKAMLRDREAEFAEALQADLAKCRAEAWCTEIGVLVGEIDYVRKRLRRWLKPEKVRAPLVTQPAKARIVREPMGVVLIIAPWNYPLNLSLFPLIGAIAAGNCAAIKPSEHAPATAAAVARWLPEYLDEDCVQVVQGGPQETQSLLQQRFDHIFYTGGAAVGRIVLEAAARNLTPVTLELGGRAPAWSMLTRTSR